MSKIPTAQEFWETLQEYREWNEKNLLHVRACYFRALGHPGKKYYMNIIRRLSDGKLFASGDRDWDEERGYTWTLLEIENPDDELGRTEENQSPHLEIIKGDEWEGNINSVMKIDGEIYERASGSLESDWAWFDDGKLFAVEPSRYGFVKDESLTWKQSVDRAKTSIDFVDRLREKREEVETYLDKGHCSLTGLTRLVRVSKDDLNDPGSISAYCSVLTHYTKTGEIISVAY